MQSKISFLSPANGVSRIRVDELTLHTQTAIWVAEKLTDAKFNVTSQSDGTNIIECHGIGKKAVALITNGFFAWACGNSI